MDDRAMTPQSWPVRSKYWGDDRYGELDEGIRYAVRVLHARGYETCQSCEGGTGHSYDYPTVDMLAGEDATGFAAAAVLAQHGLAPESVAQHWRLDVLGRPVETIWRIVLARAVPERADEPLMFVWGYQAQPRPADRPDYSHVEHRDG